MARAVQGEQGPLAEPQGLVDRLLQACRRPRQRGLASVAADGADEDLDVMLAEPIEPEPLRAGSKRWSARIRS